MPNEIRRNPLTGRREMTPAEILEREDLRYENTATRLAAKMRELRAARNGHGRGAVVPPSE